ncbi:MAG: hypothetical protein HC835_20785 [Oscillatoriales cyanobacterium RM2_1_1]|nr:hypothetical protein [Oscillatoriales cyanobacterium SM2_3_0]NJO47840.1 hypothetical protein [Oscillatoriales cyanobacterium RM2_1_1]
MYYKQIEIAKFLVKHSPRWYRVASLAMTYETHEKVIRDWLNDLRKHGLIELDNHGTIVRATHSALKTDFNQPLFSKA